MTAPPPPRQRRLPLHLRAASWRLELASAARRMRGEGPPERPAPAGQERALAPPRRRTRQ